MNYSIRAVNSFSKELKKLSNRIIYLLIEDEDIVLLSIYSKSDVANISESEIDKKIIEAIEVL